VKALFSLIAVLVLILIAAIGADTTSLHFLFGIVIPYLAFIMFVGGLASGVVGGVNLRFKCRQPACA